MAVWIDPLPCYDLLALVDVVRAGQARERAIAGKELQRRLKSYGDAKPKH
jgi:hypothetical protein